MELEDELAITLTRAEWRTVMGILNEIPFRVVAPIIFKITAQAERHDNGLDVKPSSAASTLERPPTPSPPGSDKRSR